MESMCRDIETPSFANSNLTIKEQTGLHTACIFSIDFSGRGVRWGGRGEGVRQSILVTVSVENNDKRPALLTGYLYERR